MFFVIKGERKTNRRTRATSEKGRGEQFYFAH